MKMRQRNITKNRPQRTCVACRQVKAKQELIRLVCVGSGLVEVDTSGKLAGRGAYLCLAPECWQTGLMAGRVEYALRIKLSQQNRDQLIEYGKNLVGG